MKTIFSVNKKYFKAICIMLLIAIICIIGYQLGFHNGYNSTMNNLMK